MFFTKKHKYFPILLLCTLIISGCFPSNSEISELASATPEIFPGITNIPDTPDTIGNSPLTLNIWIPPFMDPDPTTPTGALLEETLSEFSARHPGVRVQIRVKSVEGVSSIFNSLYSANSAAPLSVPDLVLFQADHLQKAAEDGFIYPFDNIDGNNLLDPDWLEFANKLSIIEEHRYGLPLIADILILANHNQELNSLPTNWVGYIQTDLILSFPAADPEAIFSLLQLEAAGGIVKENSPQIQEEILKNYLTFLQEAQTSGTFPFWLTQYEDFDQSWEAFLERRADLSIHWLSAYLSNIPENTEITTLPSANGDPVSYGKTWNWAITVSPENQVRHELAKELAITLSGTEFMANLSFATHHIPTRKSSIPIWAEYSGINLSEDQISHIFPIPNQEIISLYSKSLSLAVINILKNSINPEEAVLDFMKELESK